MTKNTSHRDIGLYLGNSWHEQKGMIMKKVTRLTFLVFLIATIIALGCSGSDSDGSGSCTVSGTECSFACDSNLGCVECVNNGDCGTAEPFCIQGECEECGDSDDCGAGQVCFPGDHKCEDPCETNGDCDDNNEPLCDVDNGICLECLEDAECSSGRPLCDPVTARCSECLANADCPATDPVCDLEDGECEECLVDSQCESAQVCNNDHKCHDACLSDTDCDNNEKPFCDEDRRSCVACTANDQCGTAEPICDDKGKCVGCVLDTDCAEDVPICKDEECIQCNSNSDCLDPALPRCSDDICVAN
jgi:Cys-rich repeat protein